jgi:hypothetical protein
MDVDGAPPDLHHRPPRAWRARFIGARSYEAFEREVIRWLEG